MLRSETNKHQSDANNSEKGSRNLRVTITLNEEIYNEIKNISQNMGLHPSTWISMVATSKVNNVKIDSMVGLNRLNNGKKEGKMESG